MVENNVSDLGVDPRRFVSFGVIKGFLRRVHRWPVLLASARPTKKTKAASVSAISKPLTIEQPTEVEAGTPSTVTPPRAPLRRSSTFTPRDVLQTPTNTKPDPLATTEVAKLTSSPTLPKKLEGLPALLDGSKHTDELCVIFGVGWPELERALITIGGGGSSKSLRGEGALPDDLTADKMGLVKILYR